jgi:sterol 3beta-glucosyltransferase
MNIMVMAFGSRGDVQPFLALAVALREHGHQVTLAAPKDFEDLITSCDITYLPIPIRASAMQNLGSTQQVADKGVTPSSLLAIWREIIPQIKRAMLQATHDIAEACRDMDLLIAHGFQMPFAYAIHQHLNIPLLLSIAAPTILTREFPIFPSLPFGARWYNPLTYQILVRMMYSFTTEPTNTYRKSVGLPKVSTGEMVRLYFSGKIPTYMHYSRHLSPAPRDWPESVKVMGAWSLPSQSDWTPPSDLTHFLAQGEPPIFFGFGSMPVSKPDKMSATISEALRMANLRGVLQAGWGGLSRQDDHLITIGDVPHDWLFPKMSAIVHHGGAGTTHAALWAGKPALIVPFMADQPFWARRLVELGVAVPPISPKKITSENLATALRTLTSDDTLRRRAAEMGVLLRAEQGLETMCALIETYAK